MAGKERFVRVICFRYEALDQKAPLRYTRFAVLGSSWRRCATNSVNRGLIPGISSKQQDFYHSFGCGESLFFIAFLQYIHRN